MRRRVGIVVLASLGIAAVGWIVASLGGRRSQSQPAAAAESQAPAKPAAKPSAPPPLVVGKDAPRLEDLPAEPPKPAATCKTALENEACYVCHTNYREEEFVLQHVKADVGCVKCHGESFAHRNDEDNITPPDTMFPPEEIEKNCKKCHDTHDAPAAKVIAQWQQKCPARANPKDLLCMDCHGEHRLRFRTVWWDKKTGKLGLRAQGERIRWAPDLTKAPGGKPSPQTRPNDGLDPDEEMK